MSRMIESLTLLNSKERFFLVGYALGNCAFDPSLELRGDISRVLGLSLPKTVFATMDYHLDWVFAAAKLSCEGGTSCIYEIEEGCITATQEDIDFLIAYDEGDVCHVLLLEAKGVTGWTNSQTSSKAHRLRRIFGANGQRWFGIIPHFAIISPRPPQRLAVHDWPNWMAPGGSIPWIKLSNIEGHCRVHRCDSEGKEAKDGGYWTIAPR
jgi:hypothetical protein